MKIKICSQIGQANLATNLDYHSVGYRGHISCDIEKLEQFHFRLTGPNLYQYFSGAVALLVYGLLFLVWPGEMQKLLFSFIRIVDLCFRNERLNTTYFAD